MLVFLCLFAFGFCSWPDTFFSSTCDCPAFACVLCTLNGFASHLTEWLLQNKAEWVSAGAGPRTF